MSDVTNIALERAIKLLVATRCQYAIVTEDGQTYSNGLEVFVTKTRKRAPRKYPYGEVTAYYKPLLNITAPVGSVQVVSFGKYLPEEIRSGMCSYLSREWGKDTYISNVTNEGVEILRIA